MATCDICTEKYNKTSRKPVSCPGCKKVCCIDCVKAYILSTPHDPHCMFQDCKIQWTFSFMSETFPQTWIKGPYSEKEKAKVIDLEKALIPSTMPAVEQVRNRRVFYAESKKIAPFLHDIQILCNDIANWTGVRNDGYAPIGLVKGCVGRLKKVVDRLTFCADIEAEEKSESEDKTRKVFTKPCPADNCNGMMNGSYVCAVCSTKVCPSCFAIKRLKMEEVKEEHVCKEEDIETANLIKRETKQCPKCAVNIFKIEGCSQMWCTNCNTAFDWRSGQVINGAIHNPHFFEWQRMQTASGASDAQNYEGCLWPDMDNRQWWEVTNSIRALISVLHNPTYNPVSNFIRSVHHMLDWARLRPYSELNSNLRVHYILGDLSEEEFSKKTYAVFKANRFDTARWDIVEMLHRAGQSLVNSLERQPSIEVKVKQSTDLVNSIRRLVAYYNRCMWHHHKEHNSLRQFTLIEHENFGMFNRITIKSNLGGLNPRPEFDE
jgi:hypothetical protein